MPIKIIYGDLGSLSGELVINPLSGVKDQDARATRSLLTATKNRLIDKDIASHPQTIGTIFETLGYRSGFQHILHIVIPQKKHDAQDNLLRLCYLNVLNKAAELGRKDIYLPLLGIDTNGYSEDESFEILKEMVHVFQDKNKDISVTAVLTLPGATYVDRLDKGKAKPTPHHFFIAMDDTKNDSYWDYFLTYIDKRNQSGTPIAQITNEKQFTNALVAEGIKSSQMSKWKGKVKDKTGGFYYPVPAKKLLFLIVCVLDMSYEEARDCFFSFGYGLTRFQDVQAFYIEILKNPRDKLKTINDQLVRKFGASASLYAEDKSDDKNDKKS